MAAETDFVILRGAFLVMIETRPKILHSAATNQLSAGDSRHKMFVTAIGGFGTPRRLR